MLLAGFIIIYLLIQLYVLDNKLREDSDKCLLLYCSGFIKSRMFLKFKTETSVCFKEIGYQYCTKY